jgi:regulator of nucleoside diphosphate kinase
VHQRIRCGSHSSLLDSVRATSGTLFARHLRQLAEKIEEADLVPGPDMPGDVVTMNSEINLVGLDSGERLAVRLTYPFSADPSEYRISILSPMGATLLGSRVGAAVEFESGGTRKRYRIDSIVYQPEAAQHYYR